MKKVFFSLMAIAIACVGVVANVKAKENKKFITIWYLPTTTNPAFTTPQGSVQVDMTATAVQGDENSSPFDCDAEALYCAKGYRSTEVDANHRPLSGASQPSDFLKYKE